MSAQGPEETTTEGKNQARVDPKLLEILVCPLTKGPLRYDAQANELISDRAGLAYPIRDGIPIMLIDEARRLDDHTGGKAI
ncbi:MAG TPA: Trm112 family protein [Azospirillum sp.]